MSISEESRLAAHVLLDAVSAADPSESNDKNSRAVQTALANLQQTGAVTVQVAESDDEIQINVDVSDLVTPVLSIVDELATDLADCRGDDVSDVIAQVREHVDRGSPSPGV